MPNQFKTREEWLAFVTQELRPLFKKVGAPLPDKIRFAIGFMVHGYRSKHIGECHSRTASGDKHVEIFIAPNQDNPAKVAGILAHELVHAADDNKHGHRAPFKKIGLAIGLEGKATHMLPGTAMQRDVIAPILVKAGPLPHKKLSVFGKQKKQTTRLLKAECSECGYAVRVTAKWIKIAGAPFCGTRSHGRMVCDDIEEGED